MEKDRDHLVEALLKDDPAFKELYDKHRELDRRVQEMDNLAHLDYEQHLEMTRLKKLKLRNKDRMEAILNHYETDSIHQQGAHLSP